MNAPLLKNLDFWQRVVDEAPAMLWRIDENGMPVYHNKRWLDFVGLKNVENLAEAWADKLHPDDREWVMESTGESLRLHQSIRVEYRLMRWDGVYRYVLDMGEPQYGDGGEFLGFIGCSVDITEQRNNAAKLEETNRQLDRSAREIRLLNEFNDHLQVCKTIEETLPILKRYGQQLFPEASVSISLVSESRNIVEPFVSWGNQATLERMFAPDDCWALRRGKVHVESGCHNGTLCPNTRNCNIKFGYVCIPMMAYGEVLGVLNICYHSAQAECEDDQSSSRRLAQITGDQVALAIANLKLRETLQHQSTRDPLTQLYNRRFLLDNMEREFCRADQEGETIVAMMIDIDHFKKFNDSYGHEAGDLVLREFGALLKESVRSIDLPCRYGGEEFLVVLTNTCLKGALARAEEIRKLVAKMSIKHRNQPLGAINVSIGVAGYPMDAKTPQQLISQADTALYKAKKDGRNRVRQAE